MTGPGSPAPGRDDAHSAPIATLCQLVDRPRLRTNATATVRAKRATTGSPKGHPPRTITLGIVTTSTAHSTAAHRAARFAPGGGVFTWAGESAIRVEVLCDLVETTTLFLIEHKCTSVPPHWSCGACPYRDHSCM
jgi:hypothetical protein